MTAWSSCVVQAGLDLRLADEDRQRLRHRRDDLDPRLVQLEAARRLWRLATTIAFQADDALRLERRRRSSGARSASSSVTAWAVPQPSRRMTKVTPPSRRTVVQPALQFDALAYVGGQFDGTNSFDGCVGKHANAPDPGLGCLRLLRGPGRDYWSQAPPVIKLKSLSSKSSLPSPSSMASPFLENKTPPSITVDEGVTPHRGATTLRSGCPEP